MVFHGPGRVGRSCFIPSKGADHTAISCSFMLRLMAFTDAINDSEVRRPIQSGGSGDEVIRRNVRRVCSFLLAQHSQFELRLQLSTHLGRCAPSHESDCRVASAALSRPISTET